VPVAPAASLPEATSLVPLTFALEIRNRGATGSGLPTVGGGGSVACPFDACMSVVSHATSAEALPSPSVARTANR